MFRHQLRFVVRQAMCLTVFAGLGLLPHNSATAQDAARVADEKPLAADTPSATSAGTAFVAPQGWTLRQSPGLAVIEAPERGSWIAVADVDARDAESAVAAAWSAFRPGVPIRALRSTAPTADKDGWQAQRTFFYETSPSEARAVSARAMRHAGRWTVRITDLATAVAGKREAQVALASNEILPKGYVRETFAGRTAHRLDARRLADMQAFVERSREALGVPGVSIGIVQDGQVVFAGGFGVREAGKPEKVDADTLYLVASNTKSLTTLMLARLVDERRFGWETRVVDVLPRFRLGDDETTRQVRIQHLLCACTGLPRHDLEWLFGPEGATPALTLEILARMQPTSRFGEMYQYSNPIASAAGLVGGHAVYPDLELGAAYDRVMATRVFEPLGMTRTTFDFAQATRGNVALPYAFGVDGRIALVAMAQNAPIRAVRPAGGAWSNVNDMLRYVRMELAGGLLPDGTRYISREALEARRKEQVRTGKDSWYGMGLDVDASSGTPMVFHGGRLRGYRTNMAWFPEHGAGVVVLTNADSGNVLMDAVPRKLLELLFDGEPQAESAVAAAAQSTRDWIAATRKALTFPAAPGDLARLAPRYRNPELGEIRIVRDATGARFDFRTWQAPIASRRNADGTTTFVAASPGWSPEFAEGKSATGEPTLSIRDAQHAYVFTAIAAAAR